MQCPLCAEEALEPHVRLGIEIDVCPRCKGVWLDRGELDKLVAEPPGRSTTPPPAPVAPASWDRRDDGVDDRDRYPDRRDDRDRDRDRSSSSTKKGKKKRKPKSKRLSDALEDLFDDILDF